MKSPDIAAVTLDVIHALNRLNIPYVIGGSLASSAHGIARSTMDADIIVTMQADQSEPLANLLQDRFYADPAMIRRAVRTEKSFNVIHLGTMLKVDVFIRNSSTYDRETFSRRVYTVLSTNPERRAYFYSPEDILLKKLEWYRLGNEVSENQWKDILGIIRIQGAGLDWKYLRRWARKLGVLDLLNRALSRPR